MDDDRAYRALFGPLPRWGPGSEADTLRALERVREAGLPDGVVVDHGCGHGASAVPLARALPDRRVIATDPWPFALQRLAERAADVGVAIEGRPASMAEPVGEPVALVWCEAAAYAIGLLTALDTWSAELVPGGCVVVSDVEWTVARPSAGAAQFWEQEIGAPLRPSHATEGLVDALGYELLDRWTLDPATWWGGYYDPLRERIAALRADGTVAQVPGLSDLCDDLDQEMQVVRRHGHEFGYGVYVLRWPGPG